MWRQPQAAQPEMELKISFANLADALAKHIGFGRRGFCIETPHGLREGPVVFVVDFQKDGITLSGQGVVRWVAPEERMAGIEITWLEESGRAWLSDYLARSRPLAVIPRSSGEDHATQQRTA
jgi:hypothetical protein